MDFEIISVRLQRIKHDLDELRAALAANTAYMDKTIYQIDERLHALWDDVFDEKDGQGKPDMV